MPLQCLKNNSACMFSFLGSFVLFNCSDRVVRVYNSEHIVGIGKDGEVEPIQKLQDLVNR